MRESIFLNFLFNKFRKSGLPFLKLQIKFDQKILLEEAKKLDALYVPHRAIESRGWYALTLHGLSHEKTEDASKYGCEGDFCDSTKLGWTDVSLLTPEIKKFVERMGFERLGRVRIMRLDPGGLIEPHSDSRTPSLGITINFALNNPEGCVWNFTSGMKVPFLAGEAYDIDISREHTVINESNESRYHVIVHPYYHGKYKVLFVKSYVLNFFANSLYLQKKSRC